MEIRIAVPRLPQGLAMNLFGLAGLIAIVLAIGGLTGNWWWSVLAGGIVAFGMTLVAHTQAAAAAAAETEPGKPALAVARSA
jgi:hypothetical protein